MRRLNTANLLYLGMLAALIVASIVKVINYRGWERYYYGASFSAPASYPVYIREGYFILADGETAYISTENVNYRKGQWGESDYQSPSTKERLPVKLVVQYASYRDSAFYADTILLPTEKIEHAFKNVNANGIATDLYNASPVKRLDFVIGIANNGHIIVWLRDNNNEQTLLKHTLHPHQPKANETYYGEQLSKTAYLKRVFEIDSADKAAFKRGFDSPASYIDTPSTFNKLQQNNKR